MSICSETIFFGEATPLQDQKIDVAKIKVIHTADDLKNCQNGQILQRWDYISIYNDDCLPSSYTDPLRHQSDDLADSVVDYLDLKPGQDGLAAIEKILQEHNSAEPLTNVASTVPEPIRRFWQHAQSEPPVAISGYPYSDSEHNDADIDLRVKENTPHEAMKRSFERTGRDRVPSLSEGQAVFWKYSAPIFVALMHFTLAGGFSAPHLSATMQETNYLTSKSRDASYRRLLETSLMVLDCMSDMTIGQGVGWKSATRVRLLHAQVRRRIRLNQGRLKTYSYEEHGIPINQYDLAIVLGGFAIAPLWSLRRVGINLTPFESASYVKAWTHIGFYLGIDSALLERMYAQSFSTAETTFAWLAFPAFPSEVPETGTTTPAYRILSAVSGRPPAAHPIEHHLELSRMLLGTQLANQLALPRGSTSHWISSRYETTLSTFLILFGRYWPRKGWEHDRQTWFREVLYLITVYHLGEKRTTFAWRETEKHADKLGEDEGEAPGILMGPAVGRSIRKRFRWLIGEMIFGVALGVGVVGLSSFWSLRRVFIQGL